MAEPEERIEIRDGREFRVVKLPDQKPPTGRSKRTHFHFGEVGKAGDVGGFLPSREQKKKRKTRRRKR